MPFPPVAASTAFGWQGSLQAWRDRLLTSPPFRRWAERAWFTRWIARRRAVQLFDLVAGFSYSQILLACVELRLFERLAESGPLSLEDLAPRLELDLAATERLVRAAAALRLLQARPGARWGLGPLGAPMVDNPAVAAMVLHHRSVYQDLVDPVALLRSGQGGRHLACFWPYAGEQPPAALEAERVTDYSALMTASQPLVADQVLQAYPMKHHRRLLDVGGGEGGFALAVARHAPHVSVQVFDLPAVAERAQARFAQAGLSSRCTAVGGDAFSDPLPEGADLITLLRVIHDHDDARVLRLLAAARRALAPGGRLLIAEPLAETPGAEAMGHAYFGFYLLAMGRGQPRSAVRLDAMLRQSGFGPARRVPTSMPLQASVLVASVDGA